MLEVMDDMCSALAKVIARRCVTDRPEAPGCVRWGQSVEQPQHMCHNAFGTRHRTRRAKAGARFRKPLRLAKDGDTAEGNRLQVERVVVVMRQGQELGGRTKESRKN